MSHETRTKIRVNGTELKVPPFLDQQLLHLSPHWTVDEVQEPKEVALVSQKTVVQRKLEILRNQHNKASCGFTLCTTVAKPTLAKVNQGRTCQRLGDDGWESIRYTKSRSTKTFNATPVFGVLKINSLLAASTMRFISAYL